MTKEQFIQDFQGAENMTRETVVTLVETNDGYMLARAEGIADVAYSASRSSEEAMGRAASAATWGDFMEGMFETAEEALAHARWLNTLGSC